MRRLIDKPILHFFSSINFTNRLLWYQITVSIYTSYNNSQFMFHAQRICKIIYHCNSKATLIRALCFSRSFLFAWQNPTTVSLNAALYGNRNSAPNRYSGSKVPAWARTVEKNEGPALASGVNESGPWRRPRPRSGDDWTRLCSTRTAVPSATWGVGH